jgi:hypothetical protein
MKALIYQVIARRDGKMGIRGSSKCITSIKTQCYTGRITSKCSLSIHSKALSRLYQGSVKALSRLFQGFSRLFQGSIKRYQGAIKALLRLC